MFGEKIFVKNFFTKSEPNRFGIYDAKIVLFAQLNKEKKMREANVTLTDNGSKDNKKNEPPKKVRLCRFKNTKPKSTAKDETKKQV